MTGEIKVMLTMDNESLLKHPEISIKNFKYIHNFM